MIPGELRLIDTHVHLDDTQFAEDTLDVLERARSAGVTRVVNIGYRPEVWSTTLALADACPIVSYALGVHPHHAGEWNRDTEARLLHLLDDREPVAIGEIGLDYVRNLTPPDVQRHVFLRQIEIALDRNLPIVIHQRGSEGDVLSILRDAPWALRCVLHSFEGTSELAEFAVERDYTIGVGGLMTRSKSENLRTVLRAVPLNKMMIETDSPYLVPASIKSRRNEPANVRIVAERLAELKGVSLEDVARATSERAVEVFGLQRESRESNGGVE